MASAYCTPEDVMARLRLDPAHRDAAYVARCTTAACELIDEYLVTVGADGVETLPAPPFPESVRIGAEFAAIRVYRGKDAASDVSETWTGGAVGTGQLQIRVPRDPLAGLTDYFAPLKHWWGFG